MDLSLDLSTPTSHTYRDLRVVNGDLILTSDVNPSGTQFILQNILQRLRMFLGEWFLNTSLGTPYYQLIFVKGANRSQVDSALQQIIASTPGVLRITVYAGVYTSVNRLVSVNFSAACTTGQVSYNGPLNTPNAQVSQ